MTDITAPELELDTTANGTEVAEAVEPAAVAEVPQADEPKSGSLDDALARAFQKHAVEGDIKPSTPTPTPKTPEATKPVDPITGRELEPMKAPAGWTPLLKEKWSSIDPTVQKFISDREKDMAQTISKTADARRIESEFKSIIAPHEATIRQFNVPATAIVKDLMTQWAAMQNGSPQARAQIIDGLIKHFKPDIPTLVQLSNGPSVPAPAAPQRSVDELVRAELDARERASQEASIGTDIEHFAADPKHEFFESVRDQMGKIISAELVSATTMPELFKKAYDLACSQNPEVQQVLQMRGTPTASAAPPARAVSSIKPSLNSGSKVAAPRRSMSLDDAVNAAFRKHAG